MKFFLLSLLSVLVLFTYSCGGDEDKEEIVECKTNNDCVDNKICNTSTNKCETEIKTGVLTSIELDIQNTTDSKSADLLIGAKKKIIAYAIYDKDETTADNISQKVRWYSTVSAVGTASKNSNGQIEFEAKKTGVTEVYCIYQGVESERVEFTVTEGVIKSIDLESNSGNSIYLHQSVVWNIIVTFEGDKQGKLDPETVEFHSTPEGIVKNSDGEYNFTAVGTYDVWVTKDEKESSHVTIEVMDNIVTSLELTYDREEGDFIVNVAHRVIINEKYYGNGEGELLDATGLEWSCETREEDGEGNYTPTECPASDYNVDGFNITFTRADKFFVTVTKEYTENTSCLENKCSTLFPFVVIEAK